MGASDDRDAARFSSGRQKPTAPHFPRIRGPELVETGPKKCSEPRVPSRPPRSESTACSRRAREQPRSVPVSLQIHPRLRACLPLRYPTSIPNPNTHLEPGPPPTPGRRDLDETTDRPAPIPSKAPESSLTWAPWCYTLLIHQLTYTHQHTQPP